MWEQVWGFRSTLNRVHPDIPSCRIVHRVLLIIKASVRFCSRPMKFGKEFKIHLEETLPDWRDKFLCYKPLKKLLKSIPAPLQDGAENPPGSAENWFVGVLNDELEKFNDFYVDKEEEFVIRLQVISSPRVTKFGLSISL